MDAELLQDGAEDQVLSVVNRFGVVRAATVMGLTELKYHTTSRALEFLEKRSLIIKIGSLEGLGKGIWYGKRSRSWEAVETDKSLYQSTSTGIRVRRHWVGVAQCVEWWTGVDGVRIISENELRGEHGWYDKKCRMKGKYFTPVPDFVVTRGSAIWRIEVQFSRKEKSYWENRFKCAPEHGWLVWWMLDGGEFDDNSPVMVVEADGSNVRWIKASFLKKEALAHGLRAQALVHSYH